MKENQEQKKSDRWFTVFCTVMIVLLLLNTFVIKLAVVDGRSMYPTLHDRQLLLVLRPGYEASQADLVVIHTGKGIFNRDYIVKRVIAVEGQTVKIDYDLNEVSVDNVVLSEAYLNFEEEDPEEDPKKDPEDDSEKDKNGAATSDIETLNKTISEMSERLDDLKKVNEKLSKEVADLKAEAISQDERGLLEAVKKHGGADWLERVSKLSSSFRPDSKAFEDKTKATQKQEESVGQDFLANWRSQHKRS